MTDLIKNVNTNFFSSTSRYLSALPWCKRRLEAPLDHLASHWSFTINQLLSLNIGLYFDIGLSPYLWNCRQIFTSTIWTWHNNECCHNLMRLAHKVSDCHHWYLWWTAMTTHSDNHNRKKKTVILEVVPATPKNVWNTSTASSGRSDIPPFSESCPDKQWHSLGSEVQILAYC